MKKQILAAAVAATFAVPAMADIRIDGDAKYEYKHIDNDNGGTSTTQNDGFTEAHINITGKSGDTTYVIKSEIDSNDGHAFTVEDMYMTTKLGPVGAKLGNYATGTSALLGEIENGGRSYGKLTLSYTYNGIKFYAGNGGKPKNDATGYAGSQETNDLNNNAFAGVVANFSGWKVQLKKNDETKNSFGVQGTAGPVGVRFEMADADADANTGMFLDLTGKFENINLGLTMIDMDADGGITEDDSAIFAVENGSSFNSATIGGNSNIQFRASMKHDGTTYGLKAGQIGYDTAGNEDLDYLQLYAKRKLAAGATLWVGYTSEEKGSDEENTFEIDLSVKF